MSRENAPGDHGGAVHTWQVATLLARRGHAVSLLCHRRAGEPAQEQRDGVAIHRAPMGLGRRRLPLRALPALSSFRGQRFDVVMERFDTFGGLGAVYSRQTGTPLLLEVNYPHLEEMAWKWRHRGLAFASAPVVGLLRAWNAWQYARAAAVIAVRESVVPAPHRHKVRLVHWGANPEQFRTADDDPERVARLRSRLDLRGRRVVVSHGSFQPWHAPAVFPEVMARVVARVPDVAFLVLGHGGGLEEIEGQARARGLAAWCRFPGQVAHGEVPDFLASADLALAPFDSRAYPPLLEFGFFWSPAKIFEYMACGVPVVTTDQDYLRRVVEGSGAGTCVPQRDPEALAAAVAELLGDEELRRTMGRAGRRAVLETFSWQAHAEQLAGILEELAHPRSAAPRRTH